MNGPPPVRLTLDKVLVRVIQVPLRRPIVAKVGEYTHWPFILTDVLTKEDVIGHTAVSSHIGLPQPNPSWPSSRT